MNKKKTPATKRAKRGPKKAGSKDKHRLAEPVPEAAEIEPGQTSILKMIMLPEDKISQGVKFDPRWSDAGKRRWLVLELQTTSPMSTMRASIDIKAGRDGVQSPDTLDNVQQQQERELAVTRVNLETKRSGEIAAAIAAIDAGTYGICVECEDEEGIPLFRLAALPWAARCVKCADALEKTGTSEPTKETA